MTKLPTYLFAFLSLTIFLSCENKQIDDKVAVKQETPQALKDGEYAVKSYSRSSDLLENLYQELVERSPELKKLEEDLEVFKSKPGELAEKLNKYHNKSGSYYSSGEYQANSIKDGLLKKKMITLINESKSKYSKKTAEINSLLKLISQNGTTLNDHHSVLKIIVTLPILEKYQSENLPDKEEFKKLLKEQEKLIRQEDSLSSK